MAKEPGAGLGADADPTWEREVRALEAAATTYPDALPLLLTGVSAPPRRALPPRLT